MLVAVVVTLGGWRGARRRWVRLAVALVVGGLLAGAGVLAWAFPVLRLPTPTGPASVGTDVLQWTDPARPGRVVVAQVWYPAAPGDGGGAPRATYLGRDGREAAIVADGIASHFGVPPFLLSEARRAEGHARLRARPADAQRAHPALLLSPGLGGVRTQNTALAEDLASHGYVVVALDHPGDSAVVVLDDGTAVRSEVTATGDDAEDDRRASGWTTTRAADLRFVRTRLTDLPVPVDPDRVAVAGHSIGGAAAIQAAMEDPAFAAVVDLDGYPRNVDAGELRVPVLFVVAGRGSGNPANDREYAAARRLVLGRVEPTARAACEERVVPGAAHLTFTDAPLFLPPVPSLIGSGGREDGPRRTSGLVRRFLDGELRPPP